MKHQDASEMYLKSILLIEVEKGLVHAKDIADHLDVSKASVTKAITNLKKKGYILQENYGPVYLTQEGHVASKRILYKHRLIRYYLEYILDLKLEDAEENACRLEHVITDELLVAIENKIKHQFSDDLKCDLNLEIELSNDTHKAQ